MMFELGGTLEMNWPRFILLETGRCDPVVRMSLLPHTLLCWDQNAQILAPHPGLRFTARPFFMKRITWKADQTSRVKSAQSPTQLRSVKVSAQRESENQTQGEPLLCQWATGSAADAELATA